MSTHLHQIDPLDAEWQRVTRDVTLDLAQRIYDSREVPTFLRKLFEHVVGAPIGRCEVRARQGRVVEVIVLSDEAAAVARLAEALRTKPAAA